MKTTDRKPPVFLSGKARRWWREVVGEFSFDSAPEWQLLELAAGTLDRIDEARKAIAEHGLMVPTGQGGLKPNPAANLERDSKILFARLCRELRLGEPVADDTRLPRNQR